MHWASVRWKMKIRSIHGGCFGISLSLFLYLSFPVKPGPDGSAPLQAGGHEGKLQREDYRQLGLGYIPSNRLSFFFLGLSRDVIASPASILCVLHPSPLQELPLLSLNGIGNIIIGVITSQTRAVASQGVACDEWLSTDTTWLKWISAEIKL